MLNIFKIYFQYVTLVTLKMVDHAHFVLETKSSHHQVMLQTVMLTHHVMEQPAYPILDILLVVGVI